MAHKRYGNAINVIVAVSIDCNESITVELNRAKKCLERDDPDTAKRHLHQAIKMLGNSSLVDELRGLI